MQTGLREDRGQELNLSLDFSGCLMWGLCLPHFTGAPSEQSYDSPIRLEGLKEARKGVNTQIHSTHSGTCSLRHRHLKLGFSESKG